ncbi:MAG: HAD hydrolase family protein, partial [Patescibacteria group bacterium]
RISSRTAIDITKKGVDKALGVLWFSEHLKINPQEMLFVGDALGPEGNDEIVIPTGIDTREVKNPEETAKIIDEILATCDTKNA